MFLNVNYLEKKEKYLTGILSAFVIFFILVLLTGCMGSQKKSHYTKKVVSVLPLKKDTLYNSVTAIKDSKYKYALYIPDKKGALPIIFFFDAHARGSLPVKKYKTLADRYGFILAGSNNSKNGMQPYERNNIIYNFMEDVERRTPFDPTRVYVSGFSGGARIASGIGLYNSNIAAVIACAAGFPQSNVHPKSDFTFIGIVGNKDFNYLEMQTLDRKMEGMKLKHCLLVFDGKHEWPSEKIMEQAFRLLQLQAMQKENIQKNDSLITLCINNYKMEINAAQKDNNLLQAAALCRQEQVFMSGLSNISYCKKQLNKIDKNPAFNKQRYDTQLLMDKEQKLQQTLLRAIEVKDSVWWRKELAQLKSKSMNLKNKDERVMYNRLLNYLSLISYLYADNTFKKNDFEQTGKFLFIYKTADPDNPEVWFMKAEYYASNGKPFKVLPTLKKAIAKGFNEPARIEHNRFFHPFFDKPEFQDIVKQLKRKIDTK